MIKNQTFYSFVPIVGGGVPHTIHIPFTTKNMYFTKIQVVIISSVSLLSDPVFHGDSCRGKHDTHEPATQTFQHFLSQAHTKSGTGNDMRSGSLETLIRRQTVGHLRFPHADRLGYNLRCKARCYTLFQHGSSFIAQSAFFRLMCCCALNAQFQGL